MNTYQAKAMIAELRRIADVLVKIEARSDHFLVALSSVVS